MRLFSAGGRLLACRAPLQRSGHGAVVQGMLQCSEHDASISGCRLEAAFQCCRQGAGIQCTISTQRARSDSQNAFSMQRAQFGHSLLPADCCPFCVASGLSPLRVSFQRREAGCCHCLLPAGCCHPESPPTCRQSENHASTAGSSLAEGLQCTAAALFERVPRN